jgi:hypothetical protein
MVMEQSKIIRSILEKVGNENLINELTGKLTQSEIATFLLALSKETANKSTPNNIKQV